MKVLNLYAGIGGNRKLWKDVEVTAVELNPKIAEAYQRFFPQDKVMIADAHQFLLEHFEEFDFIWSSPPCQTHSSFRFNICVRFRNTKPAYPDLRLYEEIIFLSNHFKGKWVVENVKPYYDYLIKPQAFIQRHSFWSNFNINEFQADKSNIRKEQIPQLEKRYGFDLSSMSLENKRQILRNCVEPELGLHVFNCAFRIKQRTLMSEKGGD